MEAEKRAVGALLKFSRLRAVLGQVGQEEEGHYPGSGAGPARSHQVSRRAWHHPPGALTLRIRARHREPARLPAKDCAHLQGAEVQRCVGVAPGLPGSGTAGSPSGRSCIPHPAVTAEKRAPELCGVGASGR